VAYPYCQDSKYAQIRSVLQALITENRQSLNNKLEIDYFLSSYPLT
jgi:hypothetical protein